ncbi:MAG: hypothetical protein JWO44_1633 [Bacteroidetes bacterium]|nr:hypothetical protein [Bacteroidota bacterium]
MKKIHIHHLTILLFAGFLLLCTQSFAGKRYWRGNGSNKNWNSTGNWSSTLTGATGSAVPGSADSVYFDSTGVGQCSINATVSIRRLSITSYYTDTIKQNSNTITIGTSGAILSGGVFWGGTANITDNGIFTLSGCNFKSTSAALSIAGNYTFSSGTFTHNNGEVVFTATSTIANNTVFYDLTFTPAGNSTYTISSGVTLTVNHLLKTGGSAILTINTGNINVKGNITITNTSTSTTSGGSATITINDSTNQVLTGPTTALQGRLCNVIINKPAGTLTLNNIITLGDNSDWKLFSGTLDAVTDSSTVIFTRGNIGIKGKQTFYNLIFNASAVAAVDTIYSGDTLTVAGELRIEGTSGVQLNTGCIAAKKDVIITNTYTSLGAGNSTGTIIFCDTAKQRFTGSGIALAGKICNIKVDKSGGSLTLSSIITGLNSWEYVRGTVVGGSSTFYAHGGSFSMDAEGTGSTMTFGNIVFGNSTITLNGNLRASGNLTINSGTTLNGNSKKIAVGGNWDNTGTFTYAGTHVVFNGSSAQYITRVSGTVTFDTLSLNKSAGKLLLTKPVVVNKQLNFAKGVIGSTATNLLSMPDNGAVAGSDTSYVCGPMKKTGNDAFTFPLGDTLLTSGAYHPLSITAPSNTSDAFMAQYYSTGQTFGDSLQTDTLGSISTCEYWNLRRIAGSSTVIPTLSWNSNSCNISSYDDLRVAYYDTTTTPDRWKSLGNSGITMTGSRGLVLATIAMPAANGHLVLSKFKHPSNRCALLKKKLDGGYHNVTDGNLYFKYDEEYADTDGKLKFNIYDQQNQLVASNSTMPSLIQPTVAYGDNRYSLNVLSCTFGGTNRLSVGMYILEVVNEKNEKWYLRFNNSTSATLVPCH